MECPLLTAIDFIIVIRTAGTPMRPRLTNCRDIQVRTARSRHAFSEAMNVLRVFLLSGAYFVKGLCVTGIIRG